MDCGSVESVGGPFWSCTSFFAFGLGVWGCGSGVLGRVLVDV